MENDYEDMNYENHTERKESYYEESKEKTKTPQEEQIYLCLIGLSLDGVMFHNYNIDLFDLLDLQGFKKLHMIQYQNENNSLRDLKHEYITCFNKIPKINPGRENFWSTETMNVSEETIPTLLKNALNSYYDWETKVLEKFLKWRKESKDKSVFTKHIKDVMLEIERLELIMDILNEHDYNYQCIKEMSNYLYYQ